MFGRLEDIREMCADDPRILQERESDGWTIAHWAARRGYMNLMNFICERAPALLNSKALNGSTPAHFAASYGHDSILDLMGEREPASLMHQDKEGNSPAHDATRHHRMICLKLLIERSPSLIYCNNAKGKRPIDLAEREEIRVFLKDSEKASMVPAVQLQNLTKEARVLNAQNAVLALYCKHYWATHGTETALTKMDLTQPGPENNLVNAEFSRTMPREKVSRCQRVENPSLQKAWMERREKLVIETGKDWVDSMERWLFYYNVDGEDLSAIGTAKLCKGTYRKREEDKSRFGRGIYFGKEASYINDGLKPGADGKRQMLICRVVVGRSCTGHAEMTPPITATKKGSGRELTFHSLVDNEEEPLTFLVGSDDLIYPAYILTY